MTVWVAKGIKWYSGGLPGVVKSARKEAWPTIPHHYFQISCTQNGNPSQHKRSKLHQPNLKTANLSLQSVKCNRSLILSMTKGSIDSLLQWGGKRRRNMFICPVPEYENWLAQKRRDARATSSPLTMIGAYWHNYDLNNLTDKTEAITKLWVFRRFGQLGSALGGQPP